MLSVKTEKTIRKCLYVVISARQFIEFPYGNGLEVAFGGGRKFFLPNTTSDPEYPDKYGKRRDGRNLINEWKQKSASDTKFEYVWNESGFKGLNPKNVDHVLGTITRSYLKFKLCNISLRLIPLNGMFLVSFFALSHKNSIIVFYFICAIPYENYSLSRY